MSKFEPYSRRELRRRRWVWLRRNRLVVTVVVVGVAGMLAIASAAIITSLDGPARWYLLGAVHVGLLAATQHLLQSAFLAHDREAIWHVRGAWGEENTRSELQRAKRRRLIWGWIDSISLQIGDLDHVVVTRHGGLVVIDSKWRSDVTSLDAAEMARAANRAKSRAEGVARSVLRRDQRAGRTVETQTLSAIPVVVVWGAAQRTVPDGTVINGVAFLAGRKLIPWLRSLGGEVITKDVADRLLGQLQKFRASAARSA